MDTVLAAEAPIGTGGYSLLIADDQALITAAQRLRTQFLTSGREADELDAHCDHLVVRHERTGEIVGTCRMLPPTRVAAAGRRACDGAFDTTALGPLSGELVEVGRLCVHPHHRTGAVAGLLWSGLARYLHLHNKRWLVGSVPISLSDGGAHAAAVWHRMRAAHLAPPALRVRPRRNWLAEPDFAPMVAAAASAPAGRDDVPPLLRGFLRLGSWVSGEPAYAPDAGSVDLLVLLSTDRTDPRYRRRFLGATR